MIAYCINHLLRANPFGSLVKNHGFQMLIKILKELTTNIEDYDINSAKKNLITKFQKYWIKKIELNGKLDTYQKFKLEEKSI